MTGRCCILSLSAALIVATALPRVATADDQVRFNQAEAILQKDDAAAARGFSSGVLSLAIPLTDLHSGEEFLGIRCAAYAGVKGVKVDLNLRFFDLDSELLGQVTLRERTKKDGWTAPIVVPPLIEGFPFGSIFTAVAQPLGGKKIDEARVQCLYAPASLCIGSEAPTCS